MIGHFTEAFNQLVRERRLDRAMVLEKLTQAFASQAAFDAARTTTSYFGRAQEIVAPRILKLGVKYTF